MSKPVVTKVPPINMKFCVQCKKLEGTCDHSLYGVKIVARSELAKPIQTLEKKACVLGEIIGRKPVLKVPDQRFRSTTPAPYLIAHENAMVRWQSRKSKLEQLINHQTLTLLEELKKKEEIFPEKGIGSITPVRAVRSEIIQAKIEEVQGNE